MRNDKTPVELRFVDRDGMRVQRGGVYASTNGLIIFTPALVKSR